MPEWLNKRDVLHFQQALIDEFGGLHGVRDERALESTLARPLNRVAYGEGVPLHELAASYGYGFARNHVFNDGNKRISLVAIDVFLILNGSQLLASEVEATSTILRLASGELTENELAAWIEEKSGPTDL